MEIVPLGPGAPGLDILLEDYRRHAGLPEALVLSALTEALASRRSQALLAVEAGRPVGLVVLSRQGGEGRIHLLYALPDATDALPLLLERAEVELVRPGTDALSATLPLLPGLGLEALFQARGYRSAVRARMHLPLAGEVPAPTVPDGYRLVPWDGDRLGEAVTMVAAAPSEDDRLYPEFSGRAGVRRLLEGAVAGRFGRFEEALSPMALAAGGLAGFALAAWHPVLPQEGFLLDLFVAPPHRGQGLGRALVLAVATAFRRAGAGRLGLAVTLSNVIALRLYEQLGFQVEYRFAVFRKDFPPRGKG
ncbi:MAG: GNAT family N-acetyltransferase [Chloroflexia bacterium]